MAQRKVRRVKRTPTQATPRSTAREEPIEQPVAASPASRQEAKEAQLRKEYAYVLQDLRRVFIIGGAMFLLLIILGLVL